MQQDYYNQAFMENICALLKKLKTAPTWSNVTYTANANRANHPVMTHRLPTTSCKDESINQYADC
jgi:hypothetical protein